jgi:hypothetical protein
MVGFESVYCHSPIHEPHGLNIFVYSLALGLIVRDEQLLPGTYHEIPLLLRAHAYVR